MSTAQIAVVAAAVTIIFITLANCWASSSLEQCSGACSKYGMYSWSPTSEGESSECICNPPTSEKK